MIINTSDEVWVSPFRQCRAVADGCDRDTGPIQIENARYYDIILIYTENLDPLRFVPATQRACSIRVY